MKRFTVKISLSTPNTSENISKHFYGVSRKLYSYDFKLCMTLVSLEDDITGSREGYIFLCILVGKL